MPHIQISQFYKYFYNTIDANVTSWSLTFPKFNYGNETNWLTADHRGGQGIKRPFQEKHNSSSSSKSALEIPPPLIQWGTPEYGSLRKNIIDNNTFIQPRNPTKHPLLPRLDHFLQDCSTSLLSKSTGLWATNCRPDEVYDLQYPGPVNILERSSNSQISNEKDKKASILAKNVQLIPLFILP
mgnify:CR=1 FL=1